MKQVQSEIACIIAFERHSVALYYLIKRGDKIEGNRDKEGTKKKEREKRLGREKQ